MNLRTATSVKGRRALTEKELSISLSNIGSSILDDSIASTRNCENMIGAVQVPLGIAGPITIRTTTQDLRPKTYYLPLATTEGALVASVNRGCKAITESGGARVAVETIGVTRGPVFSVSTEEEKNKLENFLKHETEQIKKIAEQTSGHLTYLRYETRYEHPYGFVRFYFDTADAMGMNMVTIAVHAIALHINKALGIRCIAVSGNFCGDKKPSMWNFMNGRGKRVTAEVHIPEPVLVNVLKTTAEKFFEVWHAKCSVGSKTMGMIGNNAHIANIVAALFVATGQDIAHVTEGSMGETTTKYTPGEKDITVYVMLPDIMVGTVGGGTMLPTQKESLEILGVAGGNNGEYARIFAGIVGAAALAGEISLLASLSEGSLGKAHERLGRGGMKK